MNEPHQREEAVFEAALALQPEQRGAYLAAACGEDAPFRERVEALLRAHAQTTGILESGAAECSASTIALNLPLNEKPGDRIGRYKLLQQIGEGGCGVVYMAEQQEPVKRRVALKVIKPGMDTRQVLARFEAERQALALMDHPNIAKVLDAGATETGRPYFVMELVRGVKITEYCDDPQNSLSTEQRLQLFIQVCRAVQHAHQKGIIHRDIKPSNILVTLQEDGTAMPKVIDFGIAKATAGQPLTDKTLFTAFEQFIGTPAYMSPEQAQLTAIDIDTRSDIYSLGVLLYELLIGRTPFDVQRLFEAGLDEIRRIIREEEPPRPSTRLSKLKADEQTTLARRRQSDPGRLTHVLRGDLDWIVMKCLEKDRTRRYETANGLASDIERHLGNEPVVARPPSSAYRLQKLVRRNKVVFAAGGAVTLAMVAALAISAWGLIQEQRARRRAEANERKAQQVAEFLNAMLKYVGPSVALDRDTTLLREILDKTAEHVGSGLTNQPEVEAELRYTLGEVYFDLVELDKAESMHRQAFRLRESRLGTNNLATALSMSHLGRVLVAKRKMAEAGDLLRQALNTQRTLADDYRNIVFSLEELSVALNVLGGGKRKEAEALLRESLSIQEKLSVREDAGLATTLEHLGEVLRYQGKMQDAEDVERKALALRRKDSGNQLGLAGSLGLLADLLSSENKSDEAESLCREALSIERKLLGPANVPVIRRNAPLASRLNELGVILSSEGKLADAEGVLREAVQMHRRLFPDGSSQLAQSINDLGNLLQKEGKLGDAEAAYREAYTIRGALFGKNHGMTASSLLSFGAVLEAEGRWEEARKLYLEAAAAGIAFAEYNLGRMYKDGNGGASDLVEACKWYRKSAEHGNRGAMFMVGRAYANGYGVPRDDTEALKWYRKAAEQGHQMSQYELAWRYRNGRGVARDDAEAVRWYRRLAEQGKDDAQSYLARAYEEGLGVATNTTEAAHWRQKAVQGYLKTIETMRNGAAAGDPQSLNDLAWTFATSQRSEVRDGPIAVVMAERAVAATGHANDGFLDTLAAAYAEANRFTEAALAQRQALLIVHEERLRNDYQSRLRLYESHSVFRAPVGDPLTPAEKTPILLGGILFARGTLRAQYGQWKAAITDLEQASLLNPGDYLSLYLLAPLRVEAGDLNGYQATREAMLARFGATNDPQSAQRIVKGSLLLRPQDSDLEIIERLVGAAANSPGASFQLTKGLSEYRLGHFQTAVDLVSKATQGAADPAGVAQAYSILAMAERGLNNTDRAHAAFLQATELVGNKLAKPGSNNLGGAFHEWFIAQILFREAKSLVDGSQDAERVSK